MWSRICLYTVPFGQRVMALCSRLYVRPASNFRSYPFGLMGSVTFVETLFMWMSRPLRHCVSSGGKFAEIWDYVNDRYEPQIESYAHRVTFLNDRRMIKEWDLLTGEFLVPDLATSKQSWQQTMEALEQERSPSDHTDLNQPHRGGLREWKRWIHRILSQF